MPSDSETSEPSRVTHGSILGRRRHRPDTVRRRGRPRRFETVVVLNPCRVVTVHTFRLQILRLFSQLWTFSTTDQGVRPFLLEIHFPWNREKMSGPLTSN